VRHGFCTKEGQNQLTPDVSGGGGKVDQASKEKDEAMRRAKEKKRLDGERKAAEEAAALALEQERLAAFEEAAIVLKEKTIEAEVKAKTVIKSVRKSLKGSGLPLNDVVQKARSQILTAIPDLANDARDKALDELSAIHRAALEGANKRTTLEAVSKLVSNFKGPFHSDVELDKSLKAAEKELNSIESTKRDPEVSASVKAARVRINKVLASEKCRLHEAELKAKKDRNDRLKASQEASGVVGSLKGKLNGDVDSINALITEASAKIKKIPNLPRHTIRMIYGSLPYRKPRVAREEIRRNYQKNFTGFPR